MGSRFVIGCMAFWVAFPAVAARGPAVLVPIALVFFAWAALAAGLDPEGFRVRVRARR
jgi:hypothetical protein